MQYLKNENVKEMYLCLCSLFKIHSLKSFFSVRFHILFKNSCLDFFRQKVQKTLSSRLSVRA